MLSFQYLILASVVVSTANGFQVPSSRPYQRASTLSRPPFYFPLSMTSDDDNSSHSNNQDEAARLEQRARELRQEIQNMEASLSDNRRRNVVVPPTQPAVAVQDYELSLDGKRVLVVGANGRLGSMVCRFLLRNYRNTEVVAAVHVVGENSSTSRGYGRLSYEVGAEDGVGSIGPAWSSEDRTATFTYSDEMKEYNLQNLRVVEVELLDPIQCMTVCEGVDSVIWCATDFNGNKPRAVSGLNVAFLFRAVADPLKGRVEIEGLRNMLGALKQAKQEKSGSLNAVLGKAASSMSSSSDAIDFVLVSTAPNVLQNFETPFGEFNAIKREGEDMVQTEFPSLSYSILQMGRYDDNFVEESLDILTEEDSTSGQDAERRRINRRDAARAAVEALTDKDGEGKARQVWTAVR